MLKALKCWAISTLKTSGFNQYNFKIEVLNDALVNNFKWSKGLVCDMNQQIFWLSKMNPLTQKEENKFKLYDALECGHVWRKFLKVWKVDNSWLYHLHVHSGLEYNIMMCQACDECDMNNT